MGTTINEHSPAMHNECHRGHRHGHHDQVRATRNERRRGQRPGATIKYLRCTTSGAAGSGLGTTIKYLHAAGGINLGTTTKYLRRTTSAAANNGLGTTIKYLVKKMRAQAATWPRPTYTKVGHEFRRTPLYCCGFCCKLRAPRRGTSFCPFVCGARACSPCSLTHWEGGQ
jgi:hypothetical protein